MKELFEKIVKAMKYFFTLQAENNEQSEQIEPPEYNLQVRRTIDFILRNSLNYSYGSKTVKLLCSLSYIKDYEIKEHINGLNALFIDEYVAYPDYRNLCIVLEKNDEVVKRFKNGDCWSRCINEIVKNVSLDNDDSDVGIGVDTVKHSE